MDKQQEKQLRVFGYGLPVICLFLAWRQYAKQGAVNGWCAGLVMAAIVVIGMALFAKPWLKVLFNYWMKVAHGIGLVVTTLILTAVFFIVFTPIALVLRIMGKDLLQLRDKNKKGSYWLKREAKLTDYSRQF